MAPPDRADEPRDLDLADLGLEESRMRHNAARLASWVEWLLHPEEHEYDRMVIYPDGTKREEPGPVTKANPTPGHYDPVELPFESVVAQYPAVRQYLDGMTAFSTQQVERPDSLLAFGAAALKNVWWLSDLYAGKLMYQFPDKSEWSGPAAEQADRFFADLTVIVNRLIKIANDFTRIGPQYALIVKAARDDFDEAAAHLVTSFEEKFDKQDSPRPVDVVGIVLAAIAGAGVTYMTGGAALPIVSGAVTSAWAATFSEVARVGTEKLGSVGGASWSELAQSYMRTQADILDSAVDAINMVNSQLETLLELCKVVDDLVAGYAK